MEITVEIQDTPNPNTFKFVLNKTLLSYDSVSFSNTEEASSNPIARAIFEVAQSIKEVFITENYITVTHDGSENCEGLKNIIRSKILENINYYIPSEEQYEPEEPLQNEDLSSKEDTLINEDPYLSEDALFSAGPEYNEAYEELKPESNFDIQEEIEPIESSSPVEKAEEFINEDFPSEEPTIEEYQGSEELAENLDTVDLDDEMKKVETDRIRSIIDELIRPALQRDGGDLSIIDYNDNVLTISYKGACVTCPHAEEGTLNALLGILKEKFNQDIIVNILKNEDQKHLDQQDIKDGPEDLFYTENEDTTDQQDAEDFFKDPEFYDEDINEDTDTENFDKEKQC